MRNGAQPANATPARHIPSMCSNLAHVVNRGANNTLDFKGAKPGVLLIVGVNGGGKTTTIGKLAHKFTGEGATVRGDITHPFFSLILLPLCCLHVSLCDCGMSAIAMAVSRTPTVEQ